MSAVHASHVEEFSNWIHHFANRRTQNLQTAIEVGSTENNTKITFTHFMSNISYGAREWFLNWSSGNSSRSLVSKNIVSANEHNTVDFRYMNEDSS